jgi:PPP family 3-phenylpropionic acid transporter
MLPEPTPPATPARGAILRPAIVYAILFGAQGAYLPYISVYLASTGLDLGTVGALIALFAAVSLVAAPAWGALADSLGDIRGPVLVAGFLSGAAVVLLAVSVGPLALAVGIALLAAAWAGVIPLIDSRTVRMVGHRDRFGQARAPGSGAFVVIAFVTGAVIAGLGPGGMFAVFGPLVVVTGISAWLLLRLPASAATVQRSRPMTSGPAERAPGALSPATILGVLRTPRLGLFFLASVVIWTSTAALLGFISLRVIELGGSGTAVAATWSLGAVIEVPLMFAFPALARRFGVERLIVIGGFAFALRALISAVVDAPAAIVAASVFGGIGFSFFYVGSVTWVAGSVGRGVQATAQGIFSGTAQAMGAIGGSIVGGAIGAAYGLPVLFGVAAAGFVVGALLSWFAIGRGSADRGA